MHRRNSGVYPVGREVTADHALEKVKAIHMVGNMV